MKNKDQYHTSNFKALHALCRGREYQVLQLTQTTQMILSP